MRDSPRIIDARFDPHGLGCTERTMRQLVRPGPEHPNGLTGKRPRTEHRIERNIVCPVVPITARTFDMVHSDGLTPGCIGLV
jgi:hypothetical protein